MPRRVLAVAAAALVLACGGRGEDTPRPPEIAGQGALRDTSAVRIVATSVAAQAIGFDGAPVAAGPGSEYVIIDCRIDAPPAQVDLSDFQLVRERVAKPGSETNLGNNDDSAYFFWSYIDEAGRRVDSVPDAAGPFLVRLAFKVPQGSGPGYLFYWGLYWGPLGQP